MEHLPPRGPRRITKLGAIAFDNDILEALRDDRLIVFAGAGVSMGAPSNLPSFEELSQEIANGTGRNLSKPFDRFLGQLHHSGVAVHERAVQHLSRAESTPNQLHHAILQLFRTADRVRVVTTNFDLHFETAAEALFGIVPTVYRAPALPLGQNFTGIVHLHGALPLAQDLILTDADFGRAYLTEGWARRFLVGAFRQYTVLFIGYRHDDVVMNYLARALTADSVAGRFALTDEDERWELLGITPTRFVKSDSENQFKELYDGVQRLAERTMRGALDWQSRLAEMGNRTPPIDEDGISEIEQALQEVHTTRFLLNVARDPLWLRWLNERQYLDTLFDPAVLGERDMLLATWLAQNFVIEHSNVVFEIIAAHGLHLCPSLWWMIGKELIREKPLDESAFKRWVTILLESAPANADTHLLMRLTERCSGLGCIELTLMTFMAMCEHRLSVKLGFAWPSEEGSTPRRLNAECPSRANHWQLNEIWTKHLRPHLPRIAQPLLSGVALHLEEMHVKLAAWEKAFCESDPISFKRSAIEPHDQDQDRYHDSVDVLVDAARDALEWLAINSPLFLYAWIERLATSDAPLLRRLAVHAITVHPELSPEDRLKLLLDRLGLHGRSEHHEVHRAVAQSYPDASETARKAVIDAVLMHTFSSIDDCPAEQRTARSHFNWLSWLLLVKPDCALAAAALAPIQDQYPDWQPSDHLDFTHWMGSADRTDSESPWSVDQLLAREPREQLDDLLNFEGNRFDGPNREELLIYCCKACKHNANWALSLGQALADQAQWTSDLWTALTQGLQESELPAEGWRSLLRLVSNPALQSAHAYDISKLMYALVKNGGKPFSHDLLEQANSVVLSIWKTLESDPQSEDCDDWVSRAINHPAGVIVEYWLSSLSLLMLGKTGAERVMPENYRLWFTEVVKDPTSMGGIGRTLLASQIAFLFGLDEAWTRQHVIPLFSDSNRQKHAQAWDGFLMWGRLLPALVDALLPAFVDAMPRLSAYSESRRRGFIKLYTALATFHISKPTHALLPALFKHGSLEDRLEFTSSIGFFLRQMQMPAKQQMWNSWLRDYWKSRLQGLPAPLDETEIQEMLEWLPHLGDVFPDAVALAVNCRPIRLKEYHILHELRESKLVTRFPTQTAELLIYLSRCTAGHHAGDLAKIEARLPQLPEHVRCQLDEALAFAGVLKVQN